MNNDLKNSTPVKFLYILQIDGNGIITRKLATVPIHFQREIFAAVCLGYVRTIMT